MRNMFFAAFMMFSATGCNEGCNQTSNVDYEYRQSRLTLHQVAHGICVVVFHDDNGGSVDHVPCPVKVTVEVE